MSNMNRTSTQVLSNGRHNCSMHENGDIVLIPAKIDDRDRDRDFAPPDGGTRAWLVMVGSFFCNGILFGVINSYSVLYTEIYENLAARNVSEASGKAALVGSLAMGSTFMVSPVAGVLTDAIGIRATTLLGGALASGGMFLSSFCAYNVSALYVTYGIMYGVGCALTYTPSLTILGHYFKKYIGIVNGVVTCGSSTFTFILPPLIDVFLKNVGLVWTLRLLAVMASGIMASSLLFKPALSKKKRDAADRVTLSTAFNFGLFKNPRYLIWALVIPLSLCGYFVPYVHMMKFVKDNYPAECDGKLPVMCIGIASGVGRLIFGYVADFKGVNRILLQQLSFLVVGVMTVLLPSTTGNFWLLVFVILLMGLFDGCFIALLGPVAFDLCGQNAASQGIGFMLGLCSLPLTLGPYIAGIMYDATQSYDLAFRLSGIPPIVGAFALLAIRCIKVRPEEKLQVHSTLVEGDCHQHLGHGDAAKVVANGRLLANGFHHADEMQHACNCVRLASTGRRHVKSTCIWFDRKTKSKERVYSYSVL